MDKSGGDMCGHLLETNKSFVCYFSELCISTNRQYHRFYEKVGYFVQQFSLAMGRMSGGKNSRHQLDINEDIKSQ
jgi:hypothetical protein